MNTFEEQGKFDHLSTYPRSEMETKIVHIGFGAFHRGHQAVYNDVVNQLTGDLWGICEVSMFSSIDKLKSQNGLFSVVEQSATTVETRLVRTVSEALDGRNEGIQAIINKIAEPQVAIISLTVTEKGYCIDAQSGQLDRQNKAIIHDLTVTDEAPQSVIGVIVSALKARKDKGYAGLSIMSCDNIPENGALTKNAITGFAAELDTKLAKWIDESVSFPSTMVDRIVPAMLEEQYQLIESVTGVKDSVGVVSEDFSQWVIEDDFIAGRPQWEKAGALLVDNVVPYEEMKLRMLNGSHSFLAYNGNLAGHEYIFECMQDDALRSVTINLMKEQVQTLSSDLDVDLVKYADLLIQRFTNPNIKHKTAQIAMDGSQKLPQRALDPFSVLLSRGKSPRYVPAMVAGWAHYIIRSVKQGDVISDPLAEQFNEIVTTANNEQDALIQLLSIEKIFGSDSDNKQTLTLLVTEAFQKISEKGIHAFFAELR